jgi:hypothetical protein
MRSGRDPTSARGRTCSREAGIGARRPAKIEHASSPRSGENKNRASDGSIVRGMEREGCKEIFAFLSREWEILGGLPRAMDRTRQHREGAWALLAEESGTRRGRICDARFVRVDVALFTTVLEG